MIGKSTYIRSFTDKQLSQLQEIAERKGLSTAPDVIFFALQYYFDSSETIRHLENNKVKLQNRIADKDSVITALKATFDNILRQEMSIAKSEADVLDSKKRLFSLLHGDNILKKAV